MRNRKPPFEITNQIIDYVAEIAELVGRLTVFSPLSTSPTLRRANRIRLGYRAKYPFLGTGNCCVEW